MNIAKEVLGLIFIAVTISAQPLDGVLVCIDPGHGGHDPANDRHIVPPDFWESEGNWGKAQHLEEILTDLGAEVILTRHGNDDSDDLPLSQRAGIANSNNVDYFHSIHSNATGTSNRVNFPLILFRGYDNGPVYPESKVFANIVWRTIYEGKSGVWSYHSTVVRGDFDFYDWVDPQGNPLGLGVLRPLNMPGTLSEGSFHDYVPEARRLKNSRYLRHEAWAIARAFIDYFEAEPIQTGIVAGILRDSEEKIPASYKPLTGTQEDKKPLNYINVTLMPDSIVYVGDDFDNGYYMFDEVQPGDYKLIFQAEDYLTDSADVTVIAHKSVFRDRLMELVPNFNVPTVVEVSPADSSIGASTLGPIEILFDIRMNTDLTEQSISFDPSVNVEYEWSENNKKVSITPTSYFLHDTTYVVTIKTQAQTHFGVNLGQEYSFSFSTRSKLNLLSTYPENNAANVSTTVLIKLQFDEAINSVSLGGNIAFLDEGGNTISVRVNQLVFSKGLIEFEPSQPLDLGSEYTVRIGEGIKDVQYVPFGEEFYLKFTTENTAYSEGNILDDFETITNWKQPSEAPFTYGVNLDNTSFELVSTRKVSGSTSGGLSYEFIDDSAAVQLIPQSPINTGSANKFGTWVFGDLSNNMLEIKLVDNNNGQFAYLYDIINWTGWKMKSVNIGGEGIGSGSFNFDSYTIRRMPNGNTSGVVYFDDAQTDFTTPVEENFSTPTEFVLNQNYPNPFNPSTIISFSIPKQSLITLYVYNILGEKIATLIDNKELVTGYHKITWDGKNQSRINMPSGVYVYQINSDEFTAVKKMILVR